jgi:hypothetical protein
VKKKIIFAIAVLILFASTAIAFAMTTATTTIAITAGGDNGDIATIQTLSTGADLKGTNPDIELKYYDSVTTNKNIAPEWNPVIDHAENITAGDLYYVDCGEYAGNILVTLHLTNASELSHNYSYLDMRVNIREGSSGSWTQTSEANTSATIADNTVYMSFVDGAVTFILEGGKEYCISIDGGDCYCISTDESHGGSLSPDFYLNVSPI